MPETNQQIRPLDIAFNLLYYMHTTWPVHEHYFCNETCLSILFNKKIENFVIITSALPEYIEKRFHNLCFERSQDRGLHRFKIIYDGLPITIMSVDEYPWLESYVEKYANFNAELFTKNCIDPSFVEITAANLVTRLGSDNDTIKTNLAGYVS